MSETCKTCQYWTPNRDGLGGCESPKLIKGYHGPRPDPDGIAVEDDEGWAMETGPDFGCVNHAQKEGR